MFRSDILIYDQIEIARHALTEIERAAGETEQVESQVNAQVNRFLDLIEPDIEWQETHSTSKQMRDKVEAFRALRPKEGK